MSVLPHIRRYRELLHICDTGDSLDIEDVFSLEQLGSLLKNQAEVSASPTITAILTNGKVEQCVQLQELGPEQVSCTDCPRVLPGTTIGLRLDDSSDDISYLFRAAVTSSTYDAASGRWNLELALIGRPVVLSFGIGRVPSPEAVLKLEENFRAA
jgi:hypothetical protein